MAIAPAAAQATLIDFEAGSHPEDTVIDTEFDPPVRFVTGPPNGTSTLPRMRVGSAARSGSRALDISDESSTGEFPVPELAARFTTTARSQVSLWVRTVTPACGPTCAASLRLEAFDTADNRVAVSGGGAFTTVSVGQGWTQLSAATSPPSASIVRFRVISDRSGTTQGQEVLVDDLVFDDPVGGTPDFSLRSERATQFVPAGTSRNTTISIDRINGSNGNVRFSASGLPAGVSASFTPNPATGSRSSTTMTLRAASGTQSTGEPPPVVTVTGSPADASVGPAPRTVQFQLVVRRPFRVRPFRDTLDVRPCDTPAELRVYIDRERGIEDPVNLSIRRQADDAPLPAEFTAEFDPRETRGSETTLQVTAADGPPTSVTAEVVGSAGSLPPSEARVILRRIGPSITAARTGTQTSFRAPQGMAPGHAVTIVGRGFCPGSQVQFGNPAATAPLTSIAPAPGEGPGAVRATVVVPRLATDGPLTITTPGGAIGASSFALDIVGYRDTFGFSWQNDRWRGGLRYFQELFGPAQTNVSVDPCLFIDDCPIVTPLPDPVFLVYMEIARAALSGSSGTCVGFALGSRRVATRRLRPSPSRPTVWDYQQTDRVPGRGDIPFQRQRSYELGAWLDILHIAQTSAEFLNRWFERIRRYAAGGQELLRSDLERELRAGRRPLVTMLDQDGAFDFNGHAVIAYDIEDRPGGGFFIRVYDPNDPYVTTEAGNAIATADPDGAGPMPPPDTRLLRVANEEDSRITVTRNGWSFPNFDPAPDGRPDWDGPFGTIAWISTETEIPETPNTPVSLDGLAALFMGAGRPVGATATAVAGSSGSPAAPAQGRDDVVPLVPLNHPDPSPMFLFSPGRERTFQLRSDGRGIQQAALMGDGGLARLTARAGRGATADLEVMSRRRGFQYRPRARRVRLSADLAATARGGSRRTVRVSTGSFTPRRGSGGGIEVSTDRRGRGFVYRHDGSSTTLRLELASSSENGLPQRFVGSAIRVRRGDRVSVAPAWSGLGRVTVTIRNGGRTRRRVLRNRVRPAAVVRSVRAHARRRGARADVTVRPRLRGRLRTATMVVSVAIVRGRRTVAEDSRSIRRPRSRPVRFRIPLPRSARGRLSVRTSVVLLSGRPLPASSAKQRTVRLRRR